MWQGNPYSLHVDFENGRWSVPKKALDWSPRPAGAFSRLDIGLGWATQLGLASKIGQTFALTSLGRQILKRWDEENSHWA